MLIDLFWEIRGHNLMKKSSEQFFQQNANTSSLSIFRGITGYLLLFKLLLTCYSDKFRTIHVVQAKLTVTVQSIQENRRKFCNLTVTHHLNLAIIHGFRDKQEELISRHQWLAPFMYYKHMCTTFEFHLKKSISLEIRSVDLMYFQ